MNQLIEWVRGLPPSVLGKTVSLGLTVVLGFLCIRIVLATVTRTLLRKAGDHYRLLARNVIIYTGAVILGMTVLGELGFDLKTLLGAAGIVGIAIGFASQTSVSNMISGFFLLGEKPFTVGDVIKLGDKTGIILSIDLMSIKIRTFDNLFIRIPNEKVLNTEVVNVTRFPIRRLDLTVSAAYKEDVGRVKDILTDVAKTDPFVLREPEPLVIIQNYGASGIDFFIGVWFLKTDYVQVKNSIMQRVKERLDAEGVEIPFPHLSIYAGEATKPFPVLTVRSPNDASAL